MSDQHDWGGRDDDVGLSQAVASEWTKLVSVPSSAWLVAALGLALPFISVVVAATGSLQPDDTVLGASVLGGASIALVLAGVLGASTMTSEYRTGQIALTLCTTPRRWLVVASKALVVGMVVFLVALPSVAVAHGLGWLIIDRSQHATGEAFPALVGVAVVLSAIGVLGVAVGVVLRGPAAAVGAVVGIVVLPGVFAPMLGVAQPWVGGASLLGVLAKMTQSSDASPDAVGTLGAVPSLGVVATYTLAALLVAGAVIRRRDLS